MGMAFVVNHFELHPEELTFPMKEFGRPSANKKIFRVFA